VHRNTKRVHIRTLPLGKVRVADNMTRTAEKALRRAMTLMQTSEKRIYVLQHCCFV
jgi:hypothetical protein